MSDCAVGQLARRTYTSAGASRHSLLSPEQNAMRCYLLLLGDGPLRGRTDPRNRGDAGSPALLTPTPVTSAHDVAHVAPVAFSCS